MGELETRDLILLHARRLFLRRGFADVAVGDVAEAVGVTKPTLYYHFGDKEGLYAAVLIDLMERIGHYVRSVTEQQAVSVRQRLIDLATGYFLHADATMEPMLRDTNELLGTQRADEVRLAYEENLLCPIKLLLLDGMRTGDVREMSPRPLADAFLALLDAFTDPGGHTARTDDEHQATAQTLVSLFLDGAAPR